MTGRATGVYGFETCSGHVLYYRYLLLLYRYTCAAVPGYRVALPVPYLYQVPTTLHYYSIDIDINQCYQLPVPTIPSVCTRGTRSRQSRYRWYDLVLCSAPLLVVNNLTPRYHGWSNSTSVDHSMSMETSQRPFTIVPGAFLGKVFDQDTRRPWERRSIGHHRQRLFRVG